MKVQDRVVDIIADICSINASKISPESLLGNGLDMNEISFVELSVALEDEFHVKVPDSDLEGFATVGEIVEYVSSI